MGQATQHGQRFGGGRAANEFPDACPHTYKTAGPPPDAALFADSDGGAVPAADRHAAADRDSARDEPACYRTADPDAHLDSDHVGNGHVGRGHVCRDHVGNAVAAAGERGDFATPLPGATA